MLRLRVPYLTADRCRDGGFRDSVNATFRRVPDEMAGRDTVTSTLGSVRGVRLHETVVNDAPSEIAITRRMLPALGSADEDITIYAMLVFDLPPDSTSSSSPWCNRMFNKRNYWDLHSANRVSIDVTFEDDLGVDIKWLRLESHEARELFWGQKDSAIQASMQTYVTRLQAYNRDFVSTPNEQPRLWRIYGRDEIEPMHWKGFRYINRLLHYLVTTEWNIHDLAKAKHCLGLREYWTGSTLQMHSLVPSPCFRTGYGGTTSDSVRDLFADFRVGRDDRTSYEMHLEVFRSDSCDAVHGENVTQFACRYTAKLKHG